MLTVALVLSMSLRVTDDNGFSPTRPIDLDGAVAIVDGCRARAMPETCAGLLVSFAFHESLYDLQSRDPTGWTCGPFQTLASRGCPKTWTEAVDIALEFMVASAAECKRVHQPDPLAFYASGSCTNLAGITISRARLAEARRLVAWCTEKRATP